MTQINVRCIARPGTTDRARPWASSPMDISGDRARVACVVRRSGPLIPFAPMAASAIFRIASGLPALRSLSSANAHIALTDHNGSTAAVELIVAGAVNPNYDRTNSRRVCMTPRLNQREGWPCQDGAVAR